MIVSKKGVLFCAILGAALVADADARAFSGFGASRDAAMGRAPVIKVQALEPEGKGACPGEASGKKCDDANKYEPTGSPDLSTWRDGEMKESIDNAKDNYDKAVEMLGSELSASSDQDAEIYGSLIDARIQLRNQRKFQELRARAHATYQPDEQMCRFGTFVRSLAASEEKARDNEDAINGAMIGQMTNAKGTPGSGGGAEAARSENAQIDESFCNKANAGMDKRCQNAGALADRDVDFTSLVEAPLTMNVDFSNTQTEPDEESVLALERRIYWPSTFETIPESQAQDKIDDYMDQRALMATANVAQETFDRIVAAKSKGTGGDRGGAAFMKSMMREFGVSDEEIHKWLGDNPSYYAQMDVMTKKIFQGPGFYTRLYESPDNVSRANASIDAVLLMNGRERFESQLRQELLASLLLEQELKKEQRAVNATMLSGMRASQP